MSHREPQRRKDESSRHKPPKSNKTEAQKEMGFLRLQDKSGNQAVARLLEQNKVSQPNDPQEREAERLANRSAQPEQNRAKVDDEAAKTAVLPKLPELTGKGRPLTATEKAETEAKLGGNFDDVRIHTDPQASQMAEQLNARAFTYGSDIVMADGQYTPHTQTGQQLLSHELAHVVQQQGTAVRDGASPVTQTAQAGTVQRNIFGDIWEGAKSAGRAVGRGTVKAAGWLGDRARDVGDFVSGTADWVGNRLRDASMWMINLIRDLPERVARLASTLWEGFVGVITFLPEAIKVLANGGLGGLANWLWERAKSGGRWVLTFLSRIFDVLGGPEIVEFIMHLFTKTRSLTGSEIAAGSAVLGPSAVRWGDVRVANGGLLDLVFSLNDERAFVTFHTINMPEGEPLEVVVHELTHVFQYEKMGSLYMGQAIHAQSTRGGDAYNYGGAAGLVRAQNEGRSFADFNREEQGQIAQDYYVRMIEERGKNLSAQERQAYEHFINQLRTGQL